MLCMRFLYSDDSPYARVGDCMKWVKENVQNLLRFAPCVVSDFQVSLTPKVAPPKWGPLGRWHGQRHRDHR
jgi:hypothetical protein